MRRGCSVSEVRLGRDRLDARMAALAAATEVWCRCDNAGVAVHVQGRPATVQVVAEQMEAWLLRPVPAEGV
jgi:hypothetical protein